MPAHKSASLFHEDTGSSRDALGWTAHTVLWHTMTSLKEKSNLWQGMTWLVLDCCLMVHLCFQENHWRGGWFITRWEVGVQYYFCFLLHSYSVSTAFKYDMLEGASKSEVLAWTYIFEPHYLSKIRRNLDNKLRNKVLHHQVIQNCISRKKKKIKRLLCSKALSPNLILHCINQITQTKDKLTSNSQCHIFSSQKVTK